jgi:hypothetical protein
MRHLSRDGALFPYADGPTRDTPMHQVGDVCWIQKFRTNLIREIKGDQNYFTAVLLTNDPQLVLIP